MIFVNVLFTSIKKPCPGLQLSSKRLLLFSTSTCIIKKVDKLQCCNKKLCEAKRKSNFTADLNIK